MSLTQDIIRAKTDYSIVYEAGKASGGGQKLYRHTFSIFGYMWVSMMNANIIVTVINSDPNPYIPKDNQGDPEDTGTFLNPFTEEDFDFLPSGMLQVSGWIASDGDYTLNQGDKVTSLHAIEKESGGLLLYGVVIPPTEGGVYESQETLWYEDIEFIVDTVTEVM